MQTTVEIGAGGIDVVVAAGSLWVPARAAAADRRGFPTMAALRRVDPATGKVTTVSRPAGASTSTGSSRTEPASCSLTTPAGGCTRCPG